MSIPNPGIQPIHLRGIKNAQLTGLVQPTRFETIPVSHQRFK